MTPEVMGDQNLLVIQATLNK
uniref:Uncharacterized protein n=1 Tax=Anguilla anguilla TaxID=7936 RepID=A0A0E9URS0_ANGAN